MRGGHGGSRERTCGRWTSLVRGKNVQAWSEDIDAFAVVGEVGTFIAEGRGTNSDCFFRGGGGIIASIAVVVTCRSPQTYLACADSN